MLALSQGSPLFWMQIPTSASDVKAPIPFTNADKTGPVISSNLPLACIDPGSLHGALPTPVLVDKFSELLSGYPSDKSSHLIDGFTCPKLHINNLKSALTQMAVVDVNLASELAAGRLIHHLSFPHGSSINDGIPQENVSVRYASVDDAVNIIRLLGRGCYMAKTDIASAFRFIPITMSDHHLLGFSWRDKFYYDRCLPMGCSMSYNLFESFSTAVEWIAQRKLDIPHIIHV